MRPITIDAQLSIIAHPPVTETRPLKHPHSASVKLKVDSPLCLSDNQAFARRADTQPPAAARVVLTTAFCARMALFEIVM